MKQPPNTALRDEVLRQRTNKLAADIRENWQAQSITGNYGTGEDYEQRLIKRYLEEILKIIQDNQEPFTAESLIAWADGKLAFNTPAWAKTKAERDGYEKAMRHLKYHVKNPTTDII